jgi:ketosteroid isomerase-like protein
MKKLLRQLLLAASTVTSLTAAAASSPDHALAREYRLSVDDFRARQVRAYLDGNPQAILEHLSDSVRLMPAYQKTVLGKTDAGTYYGAFLQRFTVSAYERRPIETVDLGERVMETGRFSMTLATKAAQDTHTFTGKYMDLWKKSGPGKLLLDTAAWNHDEAPTSADQLRFADVPSVHMALQARLPVRAGTSLQLAALGKLQESAIIEHDGRTWALFYADDAILLANHGPVVSGRKALDDYTIAHANALPVFEKLDLRTDRIDDLGKYVVEYATGIAIWRANEHSGVSLGKNIRVWRRDDDGTLQIWRAISMYD